MDTAHRPQDLGLVKPMEDLVTSSTTTNNNNINNSLLVGGIAATATARPSSSSSSYPQSQPQSQQLMERRARSQKEQAMICPRCNSTNTKFCYYNNYSLTQPRYFCKTCRRYWTEGGSLRNVPVGGGSRKNKRSSSSASASANPNPTTPISSSSKKLLTDPTFNPNLKFEEGGHDLNLAFPDLPEFGANGSTTSTSTSITTNPSSLSAMELLRSTGIRGRGVMSPFMPMVTMPMIPEYNSQAAAAGFRVQDFRANTLSFPLDGGGGYGGMQESGGGGGGNGRLLIPFEEPGSRQQVNSNIGGGGGGANGSGQSGGGDQPLFWNGLMRGGGGGGTW